MNVPFLILTFSGIAYLAAFFFHLSSFFDISKNTHTPGFHLMRIGFLLGTFYFAAEAVESRFFLPVTNLSEALAFFSWSLAFVYLVLLTQVQSDPFGLVLTPILLILTVLSGLSFHDAASSFKVPENPFFAVHILGAFFAYAAFAISFAAGILYLIQHHQLKTKQTGAFYHKLPSLEELERLIYHPMIWGGFLLLSALVVGFIWSKKAFGQYWLADPKTVMTVVTTVVYFLVLILKHGSVLRPKQGAVATIAAFVLVLVSFLGTRFIEGSHNYLQ